jgi:hypothetical protein
MNLFFALREFVTHKNKRQFLSFVGIFTIITLGVLGGLFYYHNETISGLKRRINRINQQREEIQKILQQNQEVVAQQKEVNEILSQDPQFKIIQYFTDVLNALNIAPLNAKEPVVSEDAVDAQYIEIKLTTGLSGMNTKQLCDLLDKIEKSERIYIKELVITKNTNTASIDVMLVIATLRERTL